ncbi:hypothetical protein BDN67DRAFT_968787 [Paxillus ammoniavirescens]|nr:hypothetical protein BDN67DRAFT_968787 [Paxillus ammoniavirescens]
MQLPQTLVILAVAAYATAAAVATQGYCGVCPTQIDQWTLSSSCSSPTDVRSTTTCTYSQGASGNGAPGFCRYVDGSLSVGWAVACPSSISYDGTDCLSC